MNEEDIKIIEEIKKSIDTDYGSGRRKVQAIDNLINRNKELEEKNKKFYNGEIYTAKQLKQIEENQKKYFIHKSIVEEKIEELNNDINLAIDNSKGGLDEEFIEKGNEMLAQKKILQELLEKRK